MLLMKNTGFSTNDKHLPMDINADKLEIDGKLEKYVKSCCICTGRSVYISLPRWTAKVGLGWEDFWFLNNTACAIHLWSAHNY